MCAAINRALGMFIVQIIVVNLDVMVRHLFVKIGDFSFIDLGILYGKNGLKGILTESGWCVFFFFSKGMETYRLIIKPGK